MGSGDIKEIISFLESQYKEKKSKVIDKFSFEKFNRRKSNKLQKTKSKRRREEKRKSQDFGTNKLSVPENNNNKQRFTLPNLFDVNDLFKKKEKKNRRKSIRNKLRKIMVLNNQNTV